MSLPVHHPALVHDWLTGMRGGEKVLEALGRLFPDAPIYTLFHFPGSVSEALEAHPVETSFLQKAPGVRRHYRRYLPLFPAAVEDFDLGAHDLVISTSHCVAKGVIPPPGAHHVCYCHTPMRYAWDQEHAYFPHRRGLVARLRGIILSALRTWDVASAPRVDTFVANSRFVAERIRRYYGRTAEVIPPPVEIDFFTPDPDPDQSTDIATEPPYALAVSALVPYKRLARAAAACRRAGLELRVVGSGPDRAQLQRDWPDLRLLGRVSPEELRRQYRQATCFVQPGVEDFGIATVEALACGTPVAALGRGGVLDIVEDGVHGVLYRPPAGAGEEDHVAALAGAIDNLRQIRFNQLNLRRRAEDFSANRFDRSFRALLTGVLRPGGRETTP